MYKIYHYPKVLSHDLIKIPKSDLEKIRNAIGRKLISHPDIYGVHLRGELASCYKIRVGNYRIVYQINGNYVYILTVAHRKDAYSQAARRV